MATRDSAALSAVVNARPATIRCPNTSKYRGVIALYWTREYSRPVALTVRSGHHEVYGACSARAVSSTPSRRVARDINAARALSSAGGTRPTAARPSVATETRRGSKPVTRAPNERMLTSRVAAATSNTRLPATSTEMSTSRRRERRIRDPNIPSSPLSAAVRFVAVACSAGASPNASTLITPRPIVYATARQLGRRSMAIAPYAAGRFEKYARDTTVTVHVDNTSPSAAPSRAITRLSVSSWRTRRARDAPSASLAAISRWRARLRDSSKLARFAQAITNTSATMVSAGATMSIVLHVAGSID